MATFKRIQYVLLFLAIASLVTAYFVCKWFCFEPKTIFQALGVVIAFNFFMYKMLAGWLFINLDVKIEPERQAAGKILDDLAIKLTLKKGGIDSLWLSNIEIRLSPITVSNGIINYGTSTLIQPIGMTNFEPVNGNYWKGKAYKHYVISRKEEVAFSAYIQVDQRTVIAAEVLVLGTRPFYGIERRKDKLIQWRSSVIILPKK
jgi:hypothetical protein